MISDKGLNFFDECTAECVNMYPEEEQCTSSYPSSWEGNKMYSPGTKAISQRVPSKTNKNGVIAKERILLEQAIL